MRLSRKRKINAHVNALRIFRNSNPRRKRRRKKRKEEGKEKKDSEDPESKSFFAFGQFVILADERFRGEDVLRFDFKRIPNISRALWSRASSRN